MITIAYSGAPINVFLDILYKNAKPGNYTIAEHIKDNGVYEYSLVFDDPAEETIWRLKYK